MTKPFKFHYVHEIAGLLVLGCLLLVIVAVVFAGRAQGWFIGDVEINTEFPSEGTFGLVEGSAVQILQTTVGTLSRIEPTEEGRIRGVMNIRKDFLRYVREDSVAIARKKFGLGGDTFVEITRGSGEPLPEDNRFIPSQQDNDLLEGIEANIEEVKAAILPTITQLRLMLREYTILAADLRDPEGPLLPIMARIDGLLETVEQGEGALGRLLKDPETADQIRELLTRVNDSMTSVQEILQRLREVSDGLPASADVLEQELQELPAVVEQGRSTLREAERLLVGLQNHWLIRGAVTGEEVPPWIAPTGVSGAQQDNFLSRPEGVDSRP